MLNGEVADRISDLTESLNRTTEILSTADRMMDHYRNLNREQEFEIARLQEDLKSRNRSQRQNHEDYESDHFKIKKTSQKEVKKQKVYLTSSESSEDEFQNQRANSHKRSYSSKVKFKDNESDIFETTLNDLNKRQEHLEKELRKERQRRVDDMEQLDQLVSIKKELTSTRRKDETDDILNVRLTEIQRQLEDEHWEWKKQQQGISAEVKAIKEIIKESVTPRSIEPSSKANHSESDETILSYKKKIEKGKEIIKKLKDELHIKNRENHVFETTVDEIHAVGQMKSNQLRLLEEQLQHEKSSKSKILDELEKLKLELAASEKQRTELLIDLSTTKNETQFCKRNYEEEFADLKLLLDKNNKSKQKCLSHIEKLEIELNNRELLLQRRNHQLNDLTDRINNLEKEKQDLQMRSQESQSHIDLQKDLELTKSKLLNTQRSCRDLIKAKKDLKEKAISTIKDLRRKCSELENHANELLEANKQKSIEISKREDSQSKDGELNISKMKKEMLKVESLQMRIEDYRLKVESLTSEKAYLEENLLHAKQDAKSVIHYKKEIEKLHELTSTLKAEVSNEKQKRKELKNLLQESYEVAVSKRKETSSLLQHVQDEKSSHAELVEKLKKDHVHEMNEIIKNEEEKLKTIETLYTKLEEKFKTNEEKYEEKENGWRVLETEYQLLLEEKDKKLRVMDENNRLLLEEKEQKTRISEEENRLLLDEKVKELLKIKEENFLLNEKVHILGEENLRVRKRYQLMKKDLVGKLNTALAIQSKPALHVDQPSEWNEERFKLLLKSVLNVLSRDVENIHNLLTEEEDQNLPAREIPAGIHDECKDRVERFQEHLHTCHSIAKSLKQRYHQQKTLIQRARLKIKSLMGELENSRSQLKVEVNNYEKKCLEVEKERENDKVVLEEYKKKVQILQSRVKGLSSHLEKCTRALHGSIAMASDQKFVIDEIDQLKNEHREYQELDERFYKSEEQREVISEQLNEAKNSLTQIKQSSLDATLFSNKMIQTFGSLSPTRKRKLLPFYSPKKFTEPIGKTFAKTIYSEIESTPIKDSDLLNDTEMSLLDGALFLNPMSMNDEDFNNLFIPTKSPTTNSRK